MPTETVTTRETKHLGRATIEKKPWQIEREERLLAKIKAEDEENRRLAEQLRKTKTYALPEFEAYREARRTLLAARADIEPLAAALPGLRREAEDAAERLLQAEALHAAEEIPAQEAERIRARADEARQALAGAEHALRRARAVVPVREQQMKRARESAEEKALSLSRPHVRRALTALEELAAADATLAVLEQELAAALPGLSLGSVRPPSDIERSARAWSLRLQRMGFTDADGTTDS